METKAYPLGADSYIQLYEEEFTGDLNCIYSVTFTLNPMLNNADILTQYRQMVSEIKSIFMYRQGKNREVIWNPDIYKVYLSPELTDRQNIHFHGIFIIDPTQAHNVRDSIKSITWHSKIMGRQHAFRSIEHDVDSISRLKKYPFKDISKLKSYKASDKIYSLLFCPEEKNL